MATPKIVPGMKVYTLRWQRDYKAPGIVHKPVIETRTVEKVGRLWATLDGTRDGDRFPIAPDRSGHRRIGEYDGDAVFLTRESLNRNVADVEWARENEFRVRHEAASAPVSTLRRIDELLRAIEREGQ